MGEKMEIISYIFGIASFILTLLTFCFTLQINRKLKKESNKQQFLRDRHIYIEQLELYVETINIKDIEYNEILKILRSIDKIVEQLLLYKIWNQEILNIFKEFQEKTISIMKEMASYSFNKTHRHCYPCYSQHIEKPKVRSFITEEFRNDYCIYLNKIVAIISTDSSIM